MRAIVVTELYRYLRLRALNGGKTSFRAFEYFKIVALSIDFEVDPGHREWSKDFWQDNVQSFHFDVFRLDVRRRLHRCKQRTHYCECRKDVYFRYLVASSDC